MKTRNDYDCPIFEWTITTSLFSDSAKQDRRGCKPCTHEEFLRKLEKINQNVDVLGTYRMSLKKIHVKCKTCGKEWLVTPHNLLLGRGCPECWKHELSEKRKGKKRNI